MHIVYANAKCKRKYWTVRINLSVHPVPKPYREAIEAGRLLVVSPVAQSVTRVDARTAAIRNRYILEHSEEVVFAAIDSAGGLSQILGDYPTLKYQVLA